MIKDNRMGYNQYYYNLRENNAFWLVLGYLTKLMLDTMTLMIQH